MKLCRQSIVGAALCLFPVVKRRCLSYGKVFVILDVVYLVKNGQRDVCFLEYICNKA